MQNQQLPRFLFAPRVLGVVLLSILLLTQQVQYASAAGTGGVPVLRTFEDLPAGKAVFNDYVGVTFPQRSADFHPITIFKPSVATASPSQALQAQLRTAKFTGTQLIMSFDVPQSRVSLSTGLAPQFAGAMLLQGFSSDPIKSKAGLVDQSLTPCLGTGTTPILTSLEIDDQSARILYAQLSLVSCTAPTDPISGPSNGTIVLDNLLYNRPLHRPAREHNPPIITVTSPTNGSTVQGTTPGGVSTILLATMKETAIMSITAQVNSHFAVPMNYWNTSPGNFDAGVTIDNSSGLVEGINTVVVKVVDFDLPPNTGTARVAFTFKKLPLPPPSQVDIMPTAYEVTQTIDHGPRNNWDPTVNGYVAQVVPYPFDPPLIQGKPTLVRIYAAASGTNTPQKNVPATAFVLRDYCPSNCGIPGADGILAPISGWIAPGVPRPNISGITVSPLGTPDSVPSNATPDLRKTWDFLLPADWTQSNLVVHVNINSGNYSNLPHGTAVPECTSNTVGTCNHNNKVELHLRFLPVQQIIVNPVYLQVTGSYKGMTYNNVIPKTSQVDNIFQMLNELYPVSVIQGQSYYRTVSPGISSGDLIDFMRNNFSSNNDHEFFLGVFPDDQGRFAPNIDAAGVAYIGTQSAWADADNPIAAAHELGHDIGFEHWACENGTTDDECGVFPIPHGGIGVYGTDIIHWTVLPPGDTSSNSTPHAHDMMSYGQQCGNQDSQGKYIYGGGPGCNTGQWISWYDYGIILDHFTVDSYDPNDPPALLITGTIAPNDVATFQPIYQVDVTHPITDTIVEDDTSSIYTLQGFDSTGNVLFVHNFEPLKLDIHTAANGKALAFEEPVPVFANLQRIELLHGANVLGTLVNPAPGQKPSVSIIAPTSGTVWQVGSQQTIRWTSKSPAGVPLFAMVQYSPDGGKTRIPLGRYLTGTSLTINPDELPGSTNAMIYVQVSDGMNIATAAGPFTVQPKPPSVHIITPTTNSQVTAFVPLTLAGTAYDRQESLTDAQFQWSSDRDGVLGNGQQLTMSKLSVGHHTLTLTVTDSQGRIGRDHVQIDVAPLGGSQSPPAFDWLIFWAIAIALLLLVLVLAVIILRRRQTAGGHR
jgi:hypothetical protein